MSVLIKLELEFFEIEEVERILERLKEIKKNEKLFVELRYYDKLKEATIK